MFYEVTSALTSGYRVDVKVADHELILDQRKEVGGENLGVNPVQMVLAAIVGCRLMTASSYARKHGLDVSRFEATASCESKDLSELGKMRFQIAMTVHGSLDAQQRERLEKYVEKMCTVTAFLGVVNEIETKTIYEAS